MEPFASVLDAIKGFVQSSERFVKGAFLSRFDAQRKNPAQALDLKSKPLSKDFFMDMLQRILDRAQTVKEPSQKLSSVIEEIMETDNFDHLISQNHKTTEELEVLKRLQREAFYDLMKLRDRQDKTERMLSSFVTGKGSPFYEASTHLRGVINVGGAFLFQDDPQEYIVLNSSGIINTGIDARFTFKTSLRQKDALLAELTSHTNNTAGRNEFTGSPLVLSKVIYLASISDLLSVIAIPLGATCNDFQFASDNIQGECLTGLCLSRPPLFNRYHARGVGLSVKASKFAASVSQLGSVWRTQTDPSSFIDNLCTFFQISPQDFGETKLTLSGAWQMPFPFSHSDRLGKIGSRSQQGERELVSLLSGRRSTRRYGGCIHMLLDIDESSKFGGWVEVQKSNPNLLKWAVSLSDMPEDEIGWGVTVGGSNAEQSSSLLFEGFLNFSVGKRAIVQPGVIFKVNERGRTLACVFRSSWSM